MKNHLAVMIVGAASLAAGMCAGSGDCSARGGLPNAFQKLGRDGEVRVAYLGGSITAQNGWRPQTLRWFQDEFPAARVSEINAAIGGTGSDLGVFRLRHDVLDHHPDLLFVEFAVNDAGAPTEQIQRCMEGIVRQTWRDNPLTDICFVYTLSGNMLETLKAGGLPSSYSAMETVAAHYDIPSINLGSEVARLEAAGRLVFQGNQPKSAEEKAGLGDRILFSPDAVHPYPDTGHAVYVATIVRCLGPIRAAGSPGPHALKAPLREDNWENARMIPLNRGFLKGNWHQLDASTNSIAKRFALRMPELWRADKPGQSLRFRFRGTTAAVYDLLGPDCGQLTVHLDRQPPVVRARFDAYCTYHRLGMLVLGANLSNTVHAVEVEIHPEQPDKAKILGQRGERMEDAARYDGRAWYPGALLLVGELVE